jgi:hypothetical protein
MREYKIQQTIHTDCTARQMGPTDPVPVYLSYTLSHNNIPKYGFHINYIIKAINRGDLLVVIQTLPMPYSRL